ncbi:MAG: ABC transporter permease [Thermodesulfovibrionales bacterium]|nr:ABC transporter permease [Thermodesulfovibrionales bacterium]
MKNSMKDSGAKLTPGTIIKPRAGWQFIDFRELKEYRDLLFSLALRDVKVMYAQTIMGFSWAVLQPLVQIILFTIIFGKVARVNTDGIPYVLFSSVALIPWNYISQTMTQSTQSLVTGQHLLGKIYFPRLIFPLMPVFSKLINFGISLLIVLSIMLYYRVYPTTNMLFLPLFLIMMMLVPASIGLWFSTLAIRFRDVQHLLPFSIQLLMYTAPIIYSASSIPAKYRFIYSLNPVVGIIEGFRACLLGTPIPWPYIWPGIIVGIILFISGAFYFRRMERIVVDVI